MKLGIGLLFAGALALSSLACAPAPTLTPAAVSVRISTAAPPQDEVALSRLRAVHGEGCGFGGLLGNRDGAMSRLRNQAAQIGADYVQIVHAVEPHVEGDCRKNEYVLDAIAYHRQGTATRAAGTGLSYDAVSDTLEKARAEDLRLKWVFRLIAGGGEAFQKHPDDTPELSLPADTKDTSNTFALGVVGFDAIRMVSLSGDSLYFGYGLTAGVSEMQALRCNERLSCAGGKCVCGGDEATRTAKGFAYGPTFGLMAKRGTFPFVGFWLPSFRVYHLLSSISSKDGDCPSVYGSCSGRTFSNIAATAMIEIDWPFHDMDWTHDKLITAGCGMGVGAMAVFGDLADRRYTHFMAAVRIAINADLLSK
jgi:hypothetical protein